MPEWRVAIPRDASAYAEKLFNQKAIAEAELIGYLRGLCSALGYSMDTLDRVDTDADELVMLKPDADGESAVIELPIGDDARHAEADG